MEDRIHTTSHNPVWWTDNDTSTWHHMKDALRRDWEQTKSDFSKDGGHELNQNAVDTVVQSIGWAPIPSIGVKTREDDAKVAVRAAKKARDKTEKVSAKASVTIAEAKDDIVHRHRELAETLGEIRKDLAPSDAKATVECADAEAKLNAAVAIAKNAAAETIAKDEAKIEEARAERDEATEKWHDAEEEVRYGYFVRGRYPDDAVWDDVLESRLRSEWDALETGKAWTVSSADIHRGWDLAGKKL